MFPEREPSIDALREAPIRFRYKTPKVRRLLIDALTANAMLAVYDGGGLSDENKAKFERMISHSPERLKRIVDFCWKHVKIGG